MSVLLSLSAYAVTATNATDSSYACNYDNQRFIFLSDCFNIAWIRYLERANTSQQTLEMQYKVAKKETTRSTVCEYGDLVSIHFIWCCKINWLTVKVSRCNTSVVQMLYSYKLMLYSDYVAAMVAVSISVTACCRQSPGII